MPIPRVISILDPARLLERAVDGLIPLAPASDAQPWPTLSAWIVLRQGGLRDDLHRLAAARDIAGWFGNPVCLFNELGARWSVTEAPPPLGEPERHAIISALIEREGTALFGRKSGPEAWVPAIDRLIGELISEGITADDFERTSLATATDDFARTRADTLARIYHAWHTTLAGAGRSDGRDAKIHLARDIAAHPDAFAERLEGRRDIRFVGLADLRGGWRQLFAALAASPAVDRLEIITSFPLALPAELNAVVDLPASTVSFAESLFTNNVGSASGIRLVEAPDAAREVELIAVRVRQLINTGVAPSRIAVIARQARPLVNDVAAALGTLGVPVTVRRRTTLSHTAPARALRAILAAAADSWSRHAVVEIAENPLLATGLSARVLNLLGFAQQMASLDDWTEAFAILLARCEARERGEDDEDYHRAPLPPSGAVKAEIAAWQALLPRLKAVAAERSLHSWFEWVSETLADGPWGLSARLEEPFADREAWNADIRARDLIAELAGAWAAALAAFGSSDAPVDAATFASRLQLLLEQDLVTPPATDFGVVVAEALAASWRAFEHVFVVGLSAGVFPQRPSTSGLLDRDARMALNAAGLPLDAPDAWRDRESQLFRVACAGARTTLTLSWPVMDPGGREVARSAFADEAAAALARALGVDDTDEALEKAGVLERVPTQLALVPGFPVAADADAVAHARAAADREHARSEAPSPWNGLIEAPEIKDDIATRFGEQYQWSATQLEMAAKCRWHWFAQRLLKLEPRAEADDLMEPTVRGSLMHDALHRFFEAAKARVKGPVYLRAADSTWAETLLKDALTAAWEQAEQDGTWLGPAPLKQVARDEMWVDLLDYLSFEIEFNDKVSTANTTSSKQVQTGYESGELEFKNVPMTGAGVTFRLRGTVDRIDRGVDDRIENANRFIAAIDYKSSKGATPAGGDKAGWIDGVVLQVPLYVAALQHERPGDIVARLEYRTLRSPAPVHSLSLAPVRKGEVIDAPDAEAKLAQALDAAGRRVAQLRAGEFPAAPTESCGCSPYCPARDICRIPGGPRDVGWR
ncbi:MAG: PD-(D/E)XK nuclease family protein [Gemmatimonadaceae bacterium]|nr:PD-(D/E)XK nuclease family protein [Gemmatimonadaceae bacterium]